MRSLEIYIYIYIYTFPDILISVRVARMDSSIYKLNYATCVSLAHSLPSILFRGYSSESQRLCDRLNSIIIFTTECLNYRNKYSMYTRSRSICTESRWQPSWTVESFFFFILKLLRNTNNIIIVAMDIDAFRSRLLRRRRSEDEHRRVR